MTQTPTLVAASPDLARALEQLRLDGAIFFRSELTEPFAFALLDERFRSVLGRSPIRYLTEWRMHLADDLLASTDTGVATIARRVGYESEEAFSRAFKRARGLSPSHWRAARTN